MWRGRKSFWRSLGKRSGWGTPGPLPRSGPSWSRPWPTSPRPSPPSSRPSPSSRASSSGGGWSS
uniref:Uncharacterized protein n=1 Tax=Thermus caliditerrae TaxID=1330700 RepID=A0A7C5REA6_9DEIN